MFRVVAVGILTLRKVIFGVRDFLELGEVAGQV